MNRKFFKVCCLGLLFCVMNLFVFGDEEKIALIFKETHETVQKVLKSESIKVNRKAFEIQKAIDLGKTKLNDLKSFYIQRQIFKESDKVKVAIEKFDKTDFKKESLTPVEEKPAKSVVTTKPDGNDTQDDGNRNVSYYEAIQNFDLMEASQKDSLVRKLAKQTSNGFYSIETDHYIISGNARADRMVRLAIKMEWIARIYFDIFQPNTKKINKKIDIFAYKKYEEATTIMAEKNIKLDKDFRGNDYFDKKNNSLWLFNDANSNYINMSIYNCLANAYGDSSLDNFNFDFLRDVNEYSTLASIRKEILFSWYMSINRNSKCYNLIVTDTEKLKADLKAGQITDNFYTFKQMFMIYLINKGDFKNFKLLIDSEGIKFFQNTDRSALIDNFKAFVETEMPLAADYCGRLVNAVRYQNNQKDYNNFQENEDKIIIIDAKYSKLPMANYYKGMHYYFAGKYEDSVKAFLELKGDLDNYPFVYSLMAVDYLKLGNMAEAIRYKNLSNKISYYDPVMKNFGYDIK